MAGSLRNFQYVSDDGDVYLFRGDESNVEAINQDSANIQTANINAPGVPRNIKPRCLFYSNDARTRTLCGIASTLAIYNSPPATIPDPITSGQDLSLIRKQPEKVRLFPNFDTGLTDGDEPL